MFALRKDSEKDDTLEDVYAEELDQLEHMASFVKDIENFIPIGFVPTCFSRERKKKMSQLKIHSSTVLMNPDETLYLIMNEYFNSETLQLEETRYKGPYKMFTEYDLENLNYMQE